jgi:clathrin heavy chain
VVVVSLPRRRCSTPDDARLLFSCRHTCCPLHLHPASPSHDIRYELYEEGFVIYTKFAKLAETDDARIELQVWAIGVLVDMLHDMERAKDFAERCNEKEVWSRLGKAQLDEDLVTLAINSYIKAEDPSHYSDVIAAAEREDSYDAMVPYLVMARKQIKEAALDTTLIYAYAKSSNLSELEEFISAPNVANIQSIGERCFDEVGSTI